jgi:hypothetical protein
MTSCSTIWTINCDSTCRAPRDGRVLDDLSIAYKTVRVRIADV